METIFKISKAIVAAILVVGVFSATAHGGWAQEIGAEQEKTGQSTHLDDLFVQLKSPANQDWSAVEKDIWRAWRKSGSDSMDLLLERGRTAMAAGDLDKAIEHLTALTDHAPRFAEGWNARATAFFLMEEYGLSIRDIQATLALNPRHFGALSGLGIILERLGENESALKAFSEALAVHPRRPNLIEAVKRLTDKTNGTSL